MPQTLGELFTSVVGGLPGAEDLNAKASTASPVFTGSISLGRKANTTVGNNSFAVGNDVEASGVYSHAEGSGTKATSNLSHAEGYNTTADGICAHAEGYGTKVTNNYAHAEGYNTEATGSLSHAEGDSTTASGMYSHAEGYNATASGQTSHAEGYQTKANGISTHVSGKYNVEMISYPSWVSNTSYEVGDIIKKNGVTFGCITANNDAEFNSNNWQQLYGHNTYQAFVVGNGTADNARSNALTLDWTGDLHLAGDIYTGANANGTGGTKLARIPAAPSTDGTYMLQCVVSSGVPTYSWVSLPNASGVSF